MAANPFADPSLANEQQQIRRERVKITFYAILGSMVCLCLALLFQGCNHYEAAAENPIKNVETPAPATAADNRSPRTATSAAETNASPVLPPTTPVQVPAASPATSPATTPDAETLYVIRQGDSLARIAKIHHTTIQAIKSANGLDSDRLAVGKTLRIPAANS